MKSKNHSYTEKIASQLVVW